MKLVEKVKIVEEKSKERAKEVLEGKKLAEAVDVLRKTYADEQDKLKLFRDSTLKNIKSELDGKIKEKNALNDSISRLKEDKILAEAPLDLVNEWKKVRSDKKELELVKDDLFNREQKVISREIGVESLQKDLFVKEEKLKEDKILTNRYLSEAEQRFNQSESIKSEIEKTKEISDKQIRNEEERLRIKEVEVLTRERDVQLQKDSNQQAKIEIEKEKLHIESQQQSLKVAWDNIRKLQNK